MSLALQEDTFLNRVYRSNRTIAMLMRYRFLILCLVLILVSGIAIFVYEAISFFKADDPTAFCQGMVAKLDKTVDPNSLRQAAGKIAQKYQKYPDDRAYELVSSEIIEPLPRKGVGPA